MCVESRSGYKTMAESGDKPTNLEIIKQIQARSYRSINLDRLRILAIEYLGDVDKAPKLNDVVQEYFQRRASASTRSTARRKQNLLALAKHAHAFDKLLQQSDWLDLRDGYRAINEERQTVGSSSGAQRSPSETEQPQGQSSYPLPVILTGMGVLVELLGAAATRAAQARRPKGGRPCRPVYLANCIRELAAIWKRERAQMPISSLKERLRDGSPSFSAFVVHLLLPTDLVGRRRTSEEKMLRSAIREVLEEGHRSEDA